jgi:hypothetical protein
MKITSNKSKRTYTIKVGACIYRTVKLTAQEFSEMEYFTPGDWANYLRNEQTIIIK